jgi:hypothetical protein
MYASQQGCRESKALCVQLRRQTLGDGTSAQGIALGMADELVASIS